MKPPVRALALGLFIAPAAASAFPVTVLQQTGPVDKRYNIAPSLTWNIKWIVSKQTPADNMLEEGELAEITVDLSGLTTALAANTAFNLEIKPPTGAVLNINRTTPAAIQPVMDLN